MSELSLTISYKPRPYQSALETAMNSGKRRAVLVWARQHGKDLGCWNFLILEAMEKRGTYFYIFPEFSHGKRVIWNGITMDGRRYIDFLPAELVKHRSSSDMAIELVNGSRIQVVGSSNYDALRGTPLKGAVLSEYAYQNPNVWDMVLDPVFSNVNNKDAWVIFNSTPQGKNHFYDLYEYAKANPESWYCSRVTNDDTGLVSPEQIAAKRQRGMSEEMIQQEYYCSFDCGVVGSIYGRLLGDAEKEGRVGYVPYDRNFLVYTAWDIGIGDAMSIIFFQRRGNEILIIDHYENRGYPIRHYVDEVNARGYAYAAHYVPHDSAKRSIDTGVSFVQAGLDLGLNMIRLENNVGLIDGIERTRSYMPRMFFDKEKTDYLRRCLQQYHYEYDEKAHVQRTIPKHDWSSHAASALRYLVLSLDKVSPGSGLTPEELRKMRQAAGVPWRGAA
jgi:phage terminase large subunit